MDDNGERDIVSASTIEMVLHVAKNEADFFGIGKMVDDSHFSRGRSFDDGARSVNDGRPTRIGGPDLPPL